MLSKCLIRWTLWPALAIAALLFLGLPTGLARSEPPPAPVEDLDPSIFPPELFPGLDQLDREELILEGLVRRFPDRALRGPPPAPQPHPGSAAEELLENGAGYLRVVGLSSEDLQPIEAMLARGPLILDLRFVASDVEGALRLAEKLARRPLELETVGVYPVAGAAGSSGRFRAEPRFSNRSAPVIAIVNQETRGPIEAVLDVLQNRREIVAAGLPTPGRVATYQPIPGSPGFYVISGEIRGVSRPSLVGRGFIPAMSAVATAEEDRRGYLAFEAGRPLSELLADRVEKPRFDEARLIRHFERGLPPTAPDDPPATEAAEAAEQRPPVDAALQRALHLIEALRALGKVGPSS
jgi:hypothetical protein